MSTLTTTTNNAAQSNMDGHGHPSPQAMGLLADFLQWRLAETSHFPTLMAVPCSESQLLPAR
jgi:hypothetical protein